MSGQAARPSANSDMCFLTILPLTSLWFQVLHYSCESLTETGLEKWREVGRQARYYTDDFAIQPLTGIHHDSQALLQAAGAACDPLELQSPALSGFCKHFQSVAGFDVQTSM